ncbi:hypothetical protein RND81_05G236500 [Saponaria officinalis]|uniref:Uncharacterized protein n=1 Tax=Saponaria officinalis TaxID=3572 RepID=A0AAW1KVT1_SAPOF
MGASTSKVLSDIGSLIGNAVAAPFKSVFSRSCENVCEGIWDVVCFIEHICILDLIRFLLACCLCYICLVFLYLVYKLGICQCLAKSLCKMCWGACETYFFTLEYMCSFCWHKIRYTRRVYRGRQRARRRFLRDVESGYISPSLYRDEDIYDEFGSTLSRKRKLYREDTRRRKRRKRRRNYGNRVRLRRGSVSVRLSGRSRRRRRRYPSKSFRSSRNLSRCRKNESINIKKSKLSRSRDHHES